MLFTDSLQVAEVP